MFGAIISLVPLVLAAINLRLQQQPLTLVSLIGDGQLLIIIPVLTASAMGELFGSGSRFAVGKIILGGLSLIIIVLASYEFATVIQARAAHVAINDDIILTDSFRLFIGCILPSLISIAITEFK